MLDLYYVAFTQQLLRDGWREWQHPTTTVSLGCRRKWRHVVMASADEHRLTNDGDLSFFISDVIRIRNIIGWHQCNVQHWTEYKITLASVRCPSTRRLRPRLWGQFCTDLHQIWNIASPNIPKKIFCEQSLKWAWPGSCDGFVTP